MGEILQMGYCSLCRKYGACIDVRDYVGGVGHVVSTVCAQFDPRRPSWFHSDSACEARMDARDHEEKVLSEERLDVE